MTPITRKEYYLAKLAGQDIAVPSPIDREESYLAKLCGENVDIPTPITIDEMYLAAMCGEASDVPAPVTRLQMIWAGLLTSGEPGITPITREETIWAGITLEKWETVTGNSVTFTAKRAAPLKRLEVAIEPVQSGTGDPSPDNVRGIYGWPYTGSNNFVLFKTGKNLYVPQWLAKSGKYINLHGSHTPGNSDYYKRSRGIYLPAGKTYRIYVDPGLESAESWGIYATRNGSSSQITIKGAASRTILNETYTPTNSGYYLFWLYATSESTVTSINLDNLIVYIAEGSDAYDPNTAAVGTAILIANTTPPGMVYGGTLDVLAGVLTVTHGEIASYAGESIGEPWLSSMDVYVPGATPTTGAQVVYPLAEPLTYQLTPTEVQTLVGVNNIWSGAGPVTVEYRSN